MFEKYRSLQLPSRRVCGKRGAVTGLLWRGVTYGLCLSTDILMGTLFGSLFRSPYSILLWCLVGRGSLVQQKYLQGPGAAMCRRKIVLLEEVIICGRISEENFNFTSYVHVPVDIHRIQLIEKASSKTSLVSRSLTPSKGKKKKRFSSFECRSPHIVTFYTRVQEAENHLQSPKWCVNSTIIRVVSYCPMITLHWVLLWRMHYSRVKV